MKIDMKAMATTCAIFWGGAVLLTSLANLAWAGYAQSFLNGLSSIYPGYHATRSIGGVVLVTLYAGVDGLIAGAVFGWLYNRVTRTAA